MAAAKFLVSVSASQPRSPSPHTAMVLGEARADHWDCRKATVIETT